MENPVTVNSSTIKQFGFTAQFDLLAKKILISAQESTLLVNSGTGVASLSFEIKDPTGYTYPLVAVNPNTLADVEVNTGSVFNFGIFTIKGTITDTDGKATVVSVDKNICEPEDWKSGKVVGEFKIDVNCQIPSVEVNELTKLKYQGNGPQSISKVGFVYYPDNTLNEIAFLFTPFAFGYNDGIYTGTYKIKNTTTAVYDLLDGVTVKIPYVTRQEFQVVCDSSLREILCCINDQYDLYKKNPSSVISTNAKSKLDDVSADLFLAIINDRAGKSNADQIARIKEVLNCDCGCSPDGDYIEPQLIGGPNQIINITGEGGVTVTPQTSGDVTLYRIIGKEVSVIKQDADDLAFSIIKTGGQTTSTFALGFNYEVLAENILNIISSNEGLINILNEIIGTGTGVDISGLNGKTIINLNSCAYSLIEPSPVQKTVKSITIAGVVYNAPTGLNIRNTSGIVSWLTSLNLGVFTAALNSDSSTLTILTSNNTYAISTMSFTLNGNVLTRQFSKNCGSLTAVLQAIIDKIIMPVTTSDVKLTANISLCNVGAAATVYLAGTSFETFIQALNTKVCQYATTPVKGDTGAPGVSVQVFVQPSAPSGGTYRNGDIWIVQ